MLMLLIIWLEKTRISIAVLLTQLRASHLPTSLMRIPRQWLRGKIWIMMIIGKVQVVFTDGIEGLGAVALVRLSV
jgi:hypothetical protein